MASNPAIAVLHTFIKMLTIVNSLLYAISNISLEA